VRVGLVRNPDYFDNGRPYLDEYVILIYPTPIPPPDMAGRLSAPLRAHPSRCRAPSDVEQKFARPTRLGSCRST